MSSSSFPVAPEARPVPLANRAHAERRLTLNGLLGPGGRHSQLATLAEELSSRRYPTITEQHLARLGRLTADLLGCSNARSRALVVGAHDQSGDAVLAAIEQLGADAILVTQQLESIVRLQDEALNVRLIAAPLGPSDFETVAFFSFMREAFPSVRRVGYVVVPTADESAHGRLTLGRNHWASVVDVVVELADAGRRPPSDALIDEARATAAARPDAAAGRALLYAGLDRRYSARVRRLALHLGFDLTDAEDIAQEALLWLYEDGFPAAVWPDAEVAQLAATSMLRHRYGNRHRRSLLRSLAESRSLRRLT